MSKVSEQENGINILVVPIEVDCVSDPDGISYQDTTFIKDQPTSTSIIEIDESVDNISIRTDIPLPTVF